MSTGAFSLDQLMELAGLSVSQVGGCKNFSAYMGLRQLGLTISYLVQSTEFIPSVKAEGSWLLSVLATMVSCLCLLRGLGQCAHRVPFRGRRSGRRPPSPPLRLPAQRLLPEAA
jgi:hypothetical protein